MPNTRMIEIEERVPDALIRVLNRQTLWEPDLSQETSDISCFSDEEGPVPSKVRYAADTPTQFYEWLGTAATRLSHALVATFAATQFNIAALSSGNLPTGTFDATAIIRTISEERSSVVAISPDLIAPRTEVQDSSFLRPSGAYLTWIEMLGEPLPDDQ